MESLMLPELETEEGLILQEMLQILNYICGAPTISRQELATEVMGVASKCLKTLNSQKLKVNSLEKQLDEMHEKLRRYGEILTDLKASNCFGEGKGDQPESDSLIGATIMSSISEFKVEDVLGNGTFGVVAQCWKKPSNETVALKIIRDRCYIKEAKEEVLMLDSLKALGSEHFNIVSCNEAFISDGFFCLEFKMLDISLLDFISGQKFLLLNEIRPIIQQVAVALCFLKDAGVVHTDLKPDNIMLVDRFRQPFKVNVIDFGLAIRDPEKRTAEGFQPLGYRSPEVLLGAPFNNSIDTWSLGCIAAEMLRGIALFLVNDENEMMGRIVSILGQPPGSILDIGRNTKNFFYKRTSGQQPRNWTLKSPGVSSPQISRAHTPCVPRKLSHLVTTPIAVHTVDDHAFECDRVFFIDLVAKMLHLDPSKRISPKKILSHPFITLSHLDPQIHSSYVKSSVKHMNVCKRRFIDGGANPQWPFSRTSSTCSTSTCSISWISRHSSSSINEINMLIIEHPGNSEEEPSVQEVFIRGAKGSHNERHLGNLDHSQPVKTVKSYKRLVACNNWISDSRENEAPSFSTTSLKSNHAASDRPSSDLSSDEQISAGGLFIKKENNLSDKLHLEDLDHPDPVIRSPKPNEEETQHATCDRTSSPQQKSQSNSNNNSRRQKKAKRKQKKRKQKKKS